MTPVRLKPAAPRSRVKRTLPLSHCAKCNVCQLENMYSLISVQTLIFQSRYEKHLLYSVFLLVTPVVKITTGHVHDVDPGRVDTSDSTQGPQLDFRPS